MKAIRALLSDQPLFEGVGPGDLDFLAGCCRLVHLRAGEPVFQEGDRAERCYLVRAGTVVVGLHMPHRGAVGTATIEVGEMLGWSWLFPPHQWQLDATARDECSLLAFDATCLREKLDEEPQLGYALMTRLARQAGERLLLTRMQLADLYRTGAP